MASGTLVRKVIMQIAADDLDAEAKLDAISKKADELKAKNPELAVRIETAAASAKVAVLREELKEVSRPIDIPIEPKVDPKVAGRNAGDSFGAGFGAQGYLIAGGVAAALAALPALAAAGGATAGIALGGALLVGTKQVQGPLYAQFHSMTDGIMSVLRTAALPLVRPLGDAFAQIGRWARALYPELRAVFGSLGPLVAPLTRGLEGLVSGVMPGFLRLMRAARPAVSAVAGVLSQLGTSAGGLLSQLAPAVKSSSQFLAGLGSTVANLLPVVGQLANVLAQALGPWMQTIGSKVAPILARSIDQVLQAVTPVLPSLSQLTGLLVQMAAEGIATLAPPLAGLIGSLAGLAARVLPSLIPPMQLVIGWLTSLANTTSKVLGLLSHIPGLGFLGGLGGGVSAPSFSMPAGGGASSYSAAVASSTADGFGSWADGTTGTVASSSGSSAAASAQKKMAQAGQKLGLALTGAAAAAIGGSASAAAAKSAVGKLITDVTTAYDAGLISASKDASLAKWLGAESAMLQRDATAKQKIISEIAAAKKFAASTASNVYSNYDLSSVAGSGTSTLGIPALKGALSQDLAQIRRFSANITKLQKMGLNKAYLGQLIQMGPVNGGELANELASSKVADIRSINSAEYAISEASGQLGKTAANSMYDSGKNAGKGFLSGLEAQESAINKVMQKLAKSMVTTIRRELGIHSPSTVGHDIGSNFGTSVGAGVEAQIERAAQSSRRLSQALARGAAAHSAAGGAAGAAGQPHVTIQLVGGDREFRIWLKKMIRVTGGNVTVVGA